MLNFETCNGQSDFRKSAFALGCGEWITLFYRPLHGDGLWYFSEADGNLIIKLRISLAPHCTDAVALRPRRQLRRKQLCGRQTTQCTEYGDKKVQSERTGLKTIKLSERFQRLELPRSTASWLPRANGCHEATINSLICKQCILTQQSSDASAP